MNPKPIALAKDADIRGAWAALQRACTAAARIAQSTGTRLIVVEPSAARDGQTSGASQPPEANIPG